MNEILDDFTDHNKNDRYLLKGILYSNIFAVVAFAIAYLATNWDKEVGIIFTFTEFVLVPVAMGIIAMKFWINLGRKFYQLILPAICNTLIALALSAIFMREGVICLVIVSPLILVFMLVGMFIGKYIFKDQNKTLKTSTAFIFVGLFIFDTFSEHNYINMVSDEMTINAPKDVVWKYVAAHPVNHSKPDYWLFKIGLPNPIQSTVSGNNVGANRKCVFSNGAIFDETVSESVKDSLFTFDVIEQPNDPEIIGHIEIQRGQFILRENANHTTTLIGNSWYKLRVYPVWYYDLWAEDITREVHIRVMKHIKNLSEKDVQTGS